MGNLGGLDPCLDRQDFLLGRAGHDDGEAVPAGRIDAQEGRVVQVPDRSEARADEIADRVHLVVSNAGGNGELSDGDGIVEVHPPLVAVQVLLA